MISLKNCTLRELKQMSEGKRLFCFGSGMQLEWLSCERIGFSFLDSVEGIIDNDTSKEGDFRWIDAFKIPIISYEEFLRRKDHNTIVLITSMYFKDMIEQMDCEEQLDGMPCYVYVFLKEEYSFMDSNIITEGVATIPKKIHYCWFGKQPIPSALEKCIESWKKVCPEYEIIRHDESNYDITKNKYMQQAYEHKSWAFVSDYARVDIIHQYGGIYVDTDVEMLQSYNDLLSNEMFCGFELGNDINFGLGFGAVAGHSILKDILNLYEHLEFVDKDGRLNLTPCTIYQTECLKKYGLKQNGMYQKLESCVAYPREVFAPESFYGGEKCFSKHTHSIHRYYATWFDSDKSKEKILGSTRELLDRLNKDY